MTADANAPMTVMPRLLLDYVESGVGDAVAFTAFAACWRVGAPFLLDQLGVDRLVAILRRLGYHESVGARQRVGRWDDVEWRPGPWLGERGMRWPIEAMESRPLPTMPKPLFRGAAIDVVGDGLSWTPSRRTAADYASCRSGGRLWVCTAEPVAVLGVLTEWARGGRSKHFVTTTEFLVDPAMVEPREVRL